MTKFSSITLNDWRQFSKVSLSIHPSMTIITGANGSGKTTILKLLSQHFGWQTALLATPQKKRGTEPFKYLSGLFKKLTERRHPHDQSLFKIGELKYSNDQVANLFVPEHGQASYYVQIQDSQTVLGLNINSHRPAQSYQAIASIPTNAITAEQAYQTYHNEIIQRVNNSYTSFSPVYRMKETLISMAMFGAGNAYVQKDESLEKLFKDFKNILSKILPPSIGFEDISVRIPDVVLVTRSGEFMIDASSGGLMALIDLAWQIFLYSINKSEFTVLLDEPENHLHPSMQRSLLASLVEAFPAAQFIVATHSPFMVSSVKNSTVHALAYERDSAETLSHESNSTKVYSVELNLDTRAATANEILRDVLGVPVTLPLWAEEDLRNITARLTTNSLTLEGITSLRKELTEAGLSEYYPEALKMVAGQQP